MKKLFYVLVAATISIVPSIVLAHHPLGGLPMETFGDGLLSGFGHPILGFDHLFFVALIGVASVFIARRYISVAAYLLGMLIGCFMMSAGLGLPAKEFVIGFSLFFLGTVVLSGRSLSLVPAVLIFSVFGLFHGSAFGDSLFAQEMGVGGHVLIGYLIGLIIIQYAIIICASWTIKSLFQVTSSKAVESRISGALVAGIGLFLVMENIEGYVITLVTSAS